MAQIIIYKLFYKFPVATNYYNTSKFLFGNVSEVRMRLTEQVHFEQYLLLDPFARWFALVMNPVNPPRKSLSDT